MQEIEFSVGVKIADKDVTRIEVNSIKFHELCALWGSVTKTGVAARAELQRNRMLHQTVFKSGEEVLAASLTDLTQLPAPVAKSIVDALDHETGKAGQIVGQGDGVSKPIIYRLGDPIKISNDATITELEILGKTYGDVEDILASDTDFDKTLMIITKLATPLGAGVENMMRLPGRAADQISIGDGVTMMRLVAPAF